jgi:hypothetical protein
MASQRRARRRSLGSGSQRGSHSGFPPDGQARRPCRGARAGRNHQHPAALTGLDGATRAGAVLEATMGIEVGGLLGLVILAFDIYAIIKIINSGASTGAKVLWVLVILVLPVLGLLLWLLFGPR